MIASRIWSINFVDAIRFRLEMACQRLYAPNEQDVIQFAGFQQIILVQELVLPKIVFNEFLFIIVAYQDFLVELLPLRLDGV